MSAITAVYEDGVFRPMQPVQLPQHCEVDLEFRVRMSPGSTAGDASKSPAADVPIEDALARIAVGASIPEWEKLPADLTDNLDHYVYGTPRP